MLTTRLACPSCGVGLRVAGATPAGKQIRCPKCRTMFPVSAGDGARPRPRSAAPPGEDDENPFELVEEEAPEPRKRRPKRKAKNNSSLVLVGILAGATLLVGAAVTLGVMYW